ncbi:ABC transporter permease [Fulvivirgaceae bacterium BMA12]|uniref:ABC transporter permease n=1 Tax=Agaribacillus aureus TaxID=3051825 RepID=A0ABT8L5V6_9BACT|nr:ABC transporter permease [Fulvivirgaceae bacterium BMA12]
MKKAMPSPPKKAIKFLRWFCREDCVEEIEGDLTELFLKQFIQSPGKAKRSFTWRVIKYFRPEFIKSFEANHHHNSVAMLHNYFKISWRNLSRQKMYSTIKIGGFAIGIAACLLITLFISHELSYDRHYKNGDQIYRVVRETTFKGEMGRGAHFPHPFAAALQADYQEIMQAGRCNSAVLFGAGSSEVRRADKLESSHEDKIVFVDQSLLDIFQVSFLLGDPENALTAPNTIVITDRIRNKYFPEEDALGKVLYLNNDETRPYKISGVITDFPIKSHFRYDFLISLADREFYRGEATNWRNDNYLTYIRVHPKADVIALQEKIQSMVNKYLLPPRIKAGRAEDIAWVKSFRFRLQPVKDIYLNVDEVGDGMKHGDIRYIWLFGAISVFILLIACVNFINLSTARSANRAREVGLRKVVGSRRTSLVKQFLTESVLLSLFSFIIGLTLAWLLLPYFNSILGKEMVFPWSTWWLVPVLVGGAIVIGVIAGIYPSFYLSSFQPIQVLKGNLSRGSKNSSMRNGLVVFQFIVSIALIAGTVTINRQMDFILNKKLGFDKEQVLLLQGTHTLGDKLSIFKEELQRLPQVTSASISGYLPVEGARRNNGGWTSEGMLPEEAISGQQWSVDHDYVKTLGLNIVSGRGFSKEMSSDSQAVIINQSLASALNFQDPIGEHISNYRGEWKIIGVVEDFHFESMKREIRPLGMYIRPSTRTVAVKINTGDLQETLQSIAGLWKDFSPNQPIRYTFLNQSYAMMYNDVKRIGQMLSIFAVLAIIVACLGLFALSSFMIEQRVKEISIRLVLGASVKSILQLLTSNFVKLVMIAMVIAMPLAWYLMQKWLQDFVYKISLDWDIFVITGVLALLIALFTISYQSIHAALIKPADKLRAE